MQLIAADIGNSSTKVAAQDAGDDHRWWLQTVFHHDEPIEFGHDLKLGDRPAFWSVSSVNQSRLARLTDWVNTHRPDDEFHVIQANEIGLKTNVESRDRLGRDRLIAAWQSVALNDGGPVIVIDAGTAVTIDWVDEDCVFQGGLIFPGARSNLKTLSLQTDALPDLSTQHLDLLEFQGTLPFIGRSTESAILLGVYQTQIASMRRSVDELSKQSSQSIPVFLTGGGIPEILSWIPDDWQHVPDLVLKGAKNIGRHLIQERANKP